MPRKRCCGIIDEEPCCRRFSPAGRPSGATITVALEELEAIRLKDLVGLDQAACAESMGLTRATFQRLLASARRKVAQALTEGHSIQFEGGVHRMRNRIFECADCGKRWEEPPCTEGGKHGWELACPACGSMKKLKVAEDGAKTACGGQSQHGHGHGHGCCGHH